MPYDVETGDIYTKSDTYSEYAINRNGGQQWILPKMLVFTVRMAEELMGSERCEE